MVWLLLISHAWLLKIFQFEVFRKMRLAVENFPVHESKFVIMYGGF